jgi:uncharacterized protein (TIGR04255 family)
MTSAQTECSFKVPPLQEVSFSVQFEPISGLHLGLIGFLWNTFKDRYPLVETADELTHEIEKFGVISRKKPGFQLYEQVPIPRVLFISDDQHYLIQIQKDRFIFNWRKLLDQDIQYPRYPSLRKRFLEEFNHFKEFLSAAGLGDPECDQVEFTYVNHIDAEGRSFEQVFSNAIDESRFSPSLKLESFAINLKHIIQKGEENIGRLYTSIEKGNRLSDGKDIYVLKFVSRTHPTEPSYSGVVNAMDIMRGEINGIFCTLTSPEMHAEWEQEVGHDQ